ncbi:hypothetical protein [Pleionea mediterranea]|nr:hypothetical protein [Pleionea mediterranea]
MMNTLSVLILTRSMAGTEMLSVVRQRLETLNIDCHTLTFNPEASADTVYPHISGRINHIDKGAGVLVLIDSDATHQALFKKLSDELNVICVTGLNDAMIAAIKECDKLTLPQAAERVIQAGLAAIKKY